MFDNLCSYAVNMAASSEQQGFESTAADRIAQKALKEVRCKCGRTGQGERVVAQGGGTSTTTGIAVATDTRGGVRGGIISELTSPPTTSQYASPVEAPSPRAEAATMAANELFSLPDTSGSSPWGRKRW